MKIIGKVLATSHELGSLEGIGPLYTEIGDTGIPLLEKVLSLVIGLMTIVGGIYFIFTIITAAYTWISSQGDKNKLQQAQNKFLYALVGLLVLVAAYAIVKLMGEILGICILQLEAVFGNIWST